MSQQTSPYHKILASLQELESVCRDLKQENRALKKKISALEASFDETKSSVPTTTALMSDNDRIAVRNQIQTYIKRIDEILEESA